MKYSKTALFKTGLSLIGLLALSGCFKPQNHPTETDNATFYVDKVDGSMKAGDKVDGFSIPKSELFTFTTCTHETHSSDRIKGHKFVITGGADSVEVRTDDNGCLTWNENIEFNFLGDEYYLPITRTVTAKGIQSGARVVNLAINPWGLAENAAGVVDLTHGGQVPKESTAEAEQVKRLLKGLSASGKVVERPLYIPSTTVSSTPTDQGRNIKIDVNSQILLKDLNGKPHSFDLIDSRLLVEASLIESVTVGGKEKTRVFWRSDKAVDAKLEGAKYRAEFPVNLGALDTASKVYLTLRVSPKNGPSGLTAFEGMFEIGDYSNLLSNGTVSGSLKKSNADQSFDYSAVVQNAKIEMISTNLNQAGVVDQGSRLFRLSAVTPMMLGVVGPDGKTIISMGEDSSTRRIVSFSIKVCMTDETNGHKPVANNEKFDVTLSNGKHFVAVTNPNNDSPGCISWPESVKHNYYDVEHFYFIPIEFTHQSGFHIKKTIAVAPWERWNTWKDLDDQGQADFVRAINSRQDIPNWMQPTGFTFTQLDNSMYEVDAYLKPQLIKRAQITIPVQAWRPSQQLSGQGNPPENLRPGIYIFKAALYLQAPNPTCKMSDLACKPLDLISPLRGFKRLIQVRPDGVATGTFDFVIPDFQFMLARTFIVFELLPVNEELLSAHDKATLTTNVGDLEKLIDREAKFKRQTFVTPLTVMNDSDSRAPNATDYIGKGLLNQNGLPLTKEQIDRSLPLADVTVDQLYAKYMTQVAAYQQSLARESSIQSLAGHNLDLVRLRNEADLYAKIPALKSMNVLFKGPSPSKQLIDLMNVEINYEIPLDREILSNILTGFGPSMPNLQKITPALMKQVVEGSKGIDKPLAFRICVMLMSRMSMAADPTGTLKHDDTKSWNKDCFVALHKLGFSNVIRWERQVRVLQTDRSNPLVLTDPGNTLNFTMAAGVSFGRSAGHDHGGGFSITSAISSVPELLYYCAQWIPQTAAVRVLAFGAALPGLAGVSWKLGRDMGATVGENSSLSSTTSIAIDRFILNIPVTQSESCMTFRLSPGFLETQSSRFRFFADKFKSSEVAAVAQSRGVMICTGEADSRRRSFAEPYYVVRNDNLAGTVNDSKNINNYPWFMTIRGASDFTNFVAFAHGKYTPESSERANFDIGNLAYDRLDNAVKMYGRGRMDAIPGILTIDAPEALTKAVDFSRKLPN
jgi:hypothetical protein